MEGSIIQGLIAPVVVISACGVLCMAINNRLLSLLSRVRAFHKERIELHQIIQPGESGAVTDTRRLRYEGVQEQSQRLIERAQILRRSYICLLLCIVSMVLCSLSLGLVPWLGSFEIVSLLFFFLGLIFILIGMCFAIYELLNALKEAEWEHQRTENLPLNE